MNEFVTVDLLASFAGMVAIVCGLTQMVKHILSIDPKWIALALAFLAVLVTQVLSGPITVTSVALGLFNTLAVASAAIGLFEGAKGIKQGIAGADK